MNRECKKINGKSVKKFKKKIRYKIKKIVNRIKKCK